MRAVRYRQRPPPMTVSERVRRVTAAPRDHEAFVAYRKSLHGLGASDAAGALGVSPFRSPFETWAILSERVEPEPTTARQARGIRLEDVAADWYAEQEGRPVRRVGTVRDPRWPHLFAHPDRRAADRLVQIKTSWRDFPDDPFPVDVDVQVNVEAALTGVWLVDVVVMTFERLYPHPRVIDRKTAEDLCDWLEAWYVRHVEGDEPPRDTSAAYSRHLNAFVREAEPEPATAEQETWVAELQAVRREAKRLEARDSALVIALKESMAGGTGVKGRGWHVTWRDTKPVRRTDWRAVAQRLEPPADLIEEFTTARPNRPFKVTWDGTEEEEVDGD